MDHRIFIYLVSLVFMSAVPASRAIDADPSSVDGVKILEVRYPKRTIDSRTSDYELYWQSLLKLALDKSGIPYTLVPVEQLALTHARIVRSLNANGVVNVAYMGTSPEFEDKLQAIYFPVFRGLIGYRVLMIRRSDQQRFAQINRVSDLHDFSLGLGVQWSDIPIMQDAGFEVVEVPYESLFKALAAGRFDAVSRAVHEIEPELALINPKYPELVKEKTLVLAFQQASYFFVGKSNKRLSSAIHKGLVNAYEDGSFFKHFNESPVVHRALKILNHPDRRILWLNNKYLSKASLDLPNNYWFTLE